MSYSHTEAWLRALNQVRERGTKSAPRGQPTTELLAQELVVDNPMTFPLVVRGREFRDVIGVLEGLSLVGEVSIPELFTDRVRKFGQFTDGGTFWGAYGARAHGAMANVVELLERDPDTRQAVITYFDSGRDLNRAKRDVPCTLSSHLLLREEQLHLVTTMRSNDLWLGTPYDLIQFSILQASVAQAVRVWPGTQVHRVGSLHLYDRDAERASDLGFVGAPSMPFPLWASDGGDWSAIGSRARRLLLGTLAPITDFEKWAHGLLHGA